jgi:acetylornithine deacetylase/succinyl-diaminopimelate desuccinylase-like protein
MNNGALPGLLVATLVLLGGCTGGNNQPLEETADVSYVVDPSLKFSITSGDGTIRIYGSDSPELRIHTVKRAYSSARLQKIQQKITAQVNAVAVTTEFPPQPKWGWGDRSGTVDYTIILPQAAAIGRVELENGELLVEGIREGAVHAHLATGLMFVRNCFSDTDVAVGTGNLTLSYDWWEEIAFTASAAVRKGNVRTVIPGEAAFQLSARAPNGRITNDFLEKEERRGEPPREIGVIVHDGDSARVSIQADNGNIRIAETNP